MAKTTPPGFRSKDEILERRPVTPERRKRIDSTKRLMTLDMSLTRIRELTGVTQTAIAERMETSRPNISRIENEDDIRLSTLLRYVDAVGGSLVIEAVLPSGEHVPLVGGREPRI